MCEFYAAHRNRLPQLAAGFALGMVMMPSISPVEALFSRLKYSCDDRRAGNAIQDMIEATTFAQKNGHLEQDLDRKDEDLA